MQLTIFTNASFFSKNLYLSNIPKHYINVQVYIDEKHFGYW